MKTSDCQRADATAAPPDPRKHVNYIQGMVLGADDLIQEFAYHQNQRQWLARDAIGYGTLSGLRVTFRNDRKVSVAPGTALSPRGQLIRVTPEQCAGINDWLDLDKTKQELRKQGFALTGTEKLDAYVVLCFRDCQVDELPVPGEPCRCEDQAMAPSRILDDFRLELRLSPPAQREEDAIRDFVQWLRQIKVSNPTASGSSLDDFLDAIRAAVQDRSSPLESPPDFLYGSPPQNLVIPAAQLCEYLRAALKLWVVELRPRWQAQWAERTGGGCGCHGDEQAKGQDAEECLLLAALDITLTGGQVASANDVGVDDSKRPFVAHLRMLQEMLLCGPCCGGGCNDRTFATVFALDDHTLRIWIHHPVPVTFDSSAVQLEIDDNPVNGFTITQVAPGGSAGGLNVFDLDLGASPPGPLQRGDRVEVKFDMHVVTEVGSPPRTLAEAQAVGGWCYLDAQNGVLTTMGIVDLSDAVTVSAPVEIPPIPQPADPGIPGDMPVPENAFTPVAGSGLPLPIGSGPGVGSSDKFARADHTHGTPPDPIPPHDQDENAHRNLRLGPAPALAPPGNDVRGTAEHNIVVGLQGEAVPPPAGNGNTLVFRDNALVWEPKDDPPMIPDVVEHPAGAGRYLIVAAGFFSEDGTPILSPYNDLTATPVGSQGLFRLNFGPASPAGPIEGYVNPYDNEKFTYIVKGTIFGKVRGTFHVVEFQGNGIRVQAIGLDGDSLVSFMVEISLFGAF